MARLVALLILIAAALPAGAADRPRAGLMWNRSGLPATLPLLVRTGPGQDHVVFLADARGRDVLAGYIRGGTLYRVLVPPGTWRVRFAHGRDWTGEDGLFGADTAWTRLDEPLTFKAGVARRRGHIIRLLRDGSGSAVAAVAPLDQCQALTVTSKAVALDDRHGPDPNRLPAPGLRRLDIAVETRSRVCVQTENDVPQPQLDAALGLSITKRAPISSSAKSITAPAK